MASGITVGDVTAKQINLAYWFDLFSIGFACPIQNFVQYFCCGTEDYHYCCSPDLYMSRKEFHSDQIYVPHSSYSSDHLLFDARTPSNDQPNLVKKQFEQFQKLFLPIFLLTSSVLFLIGIAIWFWLYKHKAFYALDRDELDERNRIVARTATASRRPGLKKKQQQRNSINLTLEHPARRLSHPSTEVWCHSNIIHCAWSLFMRKLKLINVLSAESLSTKHFDSQKTNSHLNDCHSADCSTDEIGRQALDRWRTTSSCRLILSIAESSMFYISWDLTLNEDWFLFLSFLLLLFLISRSPLTFLPLVFRRISFYLLLRRDYKRQQSQSDYSQVQLHRISSCFSPLLSFQK